MREIDESANIKTPVINCVEVLIPKVYLDNNVDNVYWTLSVYSLENAPVKDNSINHADIFRFMVYDWRKSIKELLEHHQIPFTVIQYFTSDSVLSTKSLSNLIPAVK